LEDQKEMRMFRCENTGCGKVVQHHQPQNKVIIQTRPMEYEKPIIKNKKIVDTETVYGSEIAKEIACCPECYQTHTGLEPTRYIPREVVSRELNSRPARPGKKKRWENPRKRRGKKKDRQEEKKGPKVEIVNLVARK
jgi:hypothetical protein